MCTRAPVRGRTHTDTLPSEIEAAIDLSCQLKGHLPQWRLDRLYEIERIAASVSHINAYIRTLQPEHVYLATKNANLAFMGMAIEALKWADTNFWYEFAITGHSVIGEIPDCGIYPIKPWSRSWCLDQNRDFPKLEVKRFQLPLGPAYAVTAHSSQGETLAAAML